MSEPLAFRIEHRTADGLNRWLTEDAADVESARIAGCTVTALVAAPPADGRPSYFELAEALRLRGRHGPHCATVYWKQLLFQRERPGPMPECDCGLSALLSRIPKKEEG